MSIGVFRPPKPGKTRHEFRMGQRVKIARLVDSFTTPDIIGHTGTIVNQDDDWPFSFLCEVQCETCAGVHTMNEEELDGFEEPDIEELREKAGVDLPEKTPEERDRAMIDSILAVELQLISSLVQCPSVHLDPPPLSQVAAPAWRRTILFRSGMTEIGPLYQAMLKVAVAVNAKVLSLETYSRESGWVFVSAGQEDTFCIEVPVRVVLVGNE